MHGELVAAAIWNDAGAVTKGAGDRIVGDDLKFGLIGCETIETKTVSAIVRHEVMDDVA